MDCKWFGTPEVQFRVGQSCNIQIRAKTKCFGEFLMTSCLNRAYGLREGVENVREGGLLSL